MENKSNLLNLTGEAPERCYSCTDLSTSEDGLLIAQEDISYWI